MPHTFLGGRTPLEVATGKIPNLDNARIFGCAAYVQIPKYQRKGKFSDTAWRGTLVGYSTDSPEWLILDPETNNIRKAYSVKFNEHERGLGDDQKGQKQRMFSFDTLGGHVTKAVETQPTPELQSEETTEENEGLNEIRGCLANGESVSEDQSKTIEHGMGQQGAEPRPTSLESPVCSPTNSSDGDESCDSSWEGDGNDEANNQTDQCLSRGTRIRRKFNPNYMPCCSKCPSISKCCHCQTA